MQAEKEEVQFNDKVLQDLLKAFSGKLPQAKVGILGDDNARNRGGSNASIGAKHEFGLMTKISGRDVKLPIRSFLRVPIIENFQKYLEQSGMNEKTIKEIQQAKSIVPFVKRLGILAERIVFDAFTSDGFGKWKPSNMKFKKNHMTLIETSQLMNSVNSEVR